MNRYSQETAKVIVDKIEEITAVLKRARENLEIIEANSINFVATTKQIVNEMHNIINALEKFRQEAERNIGNREYYTELYNLEKTENNLEAIINFMRNDAMEKTGEISTTHGETMKKFLDHFLNEDRRIDKSTRKDVEYTKRAARGVQRIREKVDEITRIFPQKKYKLIGQKNKDDTLAVLLKALKERKVTMNKRQ